MVDLKTAQETADKLKGFSPNLSRTHYRSLNKAEHRPERRFYEIEAEKQGWSVSILERQIHSLLFGRLFKSRDKAGVLALAEQGQTVSRPIDVIKHPCVLDFLNLPDQPQLLESDMEPAIIENLHSLFFRIGQGLRFVGRQYRVAARIGAPLHRPCVL